MRHLRLLLLILLALLGSVAPLHAQEDDTGLAYGVTFSGRITNSDPRQVFYFDGLRGEVVGIDLAITGGDLDPVLMVLDNRGRVIASLDDLAGSRAPAIPRLILPYTDRFYVVVGRFGYGVGSTSGSFELSLERLGVSSASGSVLRYGDQVTNRIDSSEPQLYYSFRAAAGDIINVYMRRVSGDLDPYIQVVDASARVLAENDDLLGAASPFDSGVEGLVIEEDGTYVVVASRYGELAGTSAGSFVLTVEEADNSGRGNSPRTAVPLTLGSSAEGELDGRIYERYYTFNAQANDLITVRMSRGPTGALDSYVAIANAGLQELAADDDSGGGQNALIEQYMIPAPGKYFIIATRYERADGTSTGSYRLELESLGNAFDGVPPDVQRIAYGTTVTGRIDDATPEVRYAFRGVAGDIITVSMNQGDGDLDPVVNILNSEGRLLTGDDDGGSSNNARIDRYIIPATGTYYIQATRYSEADAPTNTRGSFILVLARRVN